MKIPPVFGYEKFKPLKKSAHNFAKNFDSKLQNCALSSKDPLGDSISFSSTAKYIKKYNTLPDEIKKILPAKDAQAMFKDMEKAARGLSKREKIGRGENAIVYSNPWLDGYCVLILNEKVDNSALVFSEKILGNSVWADGDYGDKIQIIRECA